jgi:hypothetical protein
VAEEFDAVHSVQRARQVGSVHAIIPPSQLRPRLIEAVERGIRRVLARQARGDACAQSLGEAAIAAAPE